MDLADTIAALSRGGTLTVRCGTSASSGQVSVGGVLITPSCWVNRPAATGAQVVLFMDAGGMAVAVGGDPVVGNAAGRVIATTLPHATVTRLNITRDTSAGVSATGTTLTVGVTGWWLVQCMATVSGVTGTSRVFIDIVAGSTVSARASFGVGEDRGSAMALTYIGPDSPIVFQMYQSGGGVATATGGNFAVKYLGSA